MTQGVGPFSTYDANPPVLPSGATFNDCAKQDDPLELPPNPLTDLNATEFNFMQSLLIAYAVVMPSSIVTVINGAVSSCLSPAQLVNGNLTAYSLTNPSAGTYILEWTSVGVNPETELANPANQMLPPQRAQPAPTFTGVLGANTYAISATYVTGPSGNPAVQVKTVIGGALANLPSTIGFQVSTF